ncbi:helix-turn-helix transcriptional regulator [Shinella sp.]|uniref:helix-turn-helix domain-containing protein n=1 Tax=Shinella sp. TaxID=1870904 RepID=UPI00258F205E|nr:helix-turn-helix transcriptional regulator [Shinella sp.]MCW5711308.1 helix-turn-helix transcriptional regulator [Shinella sp.]
MDYAQLGIQSIPNWELKGWFVPKMVEDDELRFREKVRDAIQAGGKSGIMSKKTGIPVGTLNKYVSLRSTPSGLNTLKIATALGITVEQLARGEVRGSNGDSQHVSVAAAIDSPTLSLRRRIIREVKHLYKISGLITRDDDEAVVAAMDLFRALNEQVSDSSDVEKVDEVMEKLLGDLRKDLQLAGHEPGKRKRSASQL